MSTTTESAFALPAGTWALDHVHSQVGFAVRYHVGTFRGSFSPVQARLEIAADGSGTLAGSVPASGVHVQDPKLSGHLLAPEFFDAERTPEITFRSTRIDVTGGAVVVEGELTIKDTTLPVVAHGTVGETTEYMDHPFVGLTLEATIDRTRYGITWQNPLPNGQPALGDDVVITAELYLVKQ